MIVTDYKISWKIKVKSRIAINIHFKRIIMVINVKK